MSPPNLPTPAFFVPLGALLSYVRGGGSGGGQRFVPVTVDDIRSGACVCVCVRACASLWLHVGGSVGAGAWTL